jgi:flagellar biosynthesis/type III secretory pathway protein FliH
LEPAVEVYTAFARQFKLGKQAQRTRSTSWRKPRARPAKWQRGRRSLIRRPRSKIKAQMAQQAQQHEQKLQQADQQHKQTLEQQGQQFAQKQQQAERESKGVPDLVKAHGEHSKQVAGAIGKLEEILTELSEELKAPTEIIKDDKGVAQAFKKGKRTIAVLRDHEGNALGLQ